MQTGTRSKRRLLLGKWEGYAWPQDARDLASEIPVVFDLRHRSTSEIYGNASYEIPDVDPGERVFNDLDGAFYGNGVFQYSFRSREAGATGFGVGFLELHASGSSLNGYAIGKARLNGRCVLSKILLIHESAPEELRRLREQFMTPTIFIGHGRNPCWTKVGQYLEKSFTCKVTSFETKSRVGSYALPVVLTEIRKASAAVLVMTKERPSGKGNHRPRENVIHEIGCAHGILGAEKTIIFQQDDMEVLSNIGGLIVIRFKKNRIEERLGELAEKVRHIFPKIKCHSVKGVAT